MPLSRNGGAKLLLFCRLGKFFRSFVLQFSVFCVILASEMKKNELSILIPTYNGDCRQLVGELSSQAEAISGLDYEIIVADDGSPDREKVDLCRQVEKHPHCRFIDRGFNAGRAAIRNFLAQEAGKAWLLFLDCDMHIFLSTYLEQMLQQEGDVVYGGYYVRKDCAPRSCLRYRYEWACQPEHNTEQRRKQPYQHFHTSNFLVSREVMLAHPFDESFRHYGYEDVLFGRRLHEAGIAINHQEIPVGFFTFEDNASFVSKTEEGLRTLYDKRDLLRGYSQMLTFVEGMRSPLLRGAIRLWHSLLGQLERRILCGTHPGLRIFKIYKLGYFLSISSAKKSQ